MLQLSPPRYLGQFYGLYAMVGRFAAIIGPLLWSVVVDGLGLGRPDRRPDPRDLDRDLDRDPARRPERPSRLEPRDQAPTQ